MPDALIFSITAVIASVLTFCASAAVLARLSAAIVTHARSGACLTTPSPLVTITGGCGCGAVVWAPAVSTAAMERHAASTRIFICEPGRSSVFFGPRSSVVGRRSSAIGLHRARHAKANRVRVGIGRHLVPMAARQHADVGHQPAPAA